MINVQEKVVKVPRVTYADLKPGDVFSWGGRSNWFIRTPDGYVCLRDGSFRPDTWIKLHGVEFTDMVRAHSATLNVEFS